MTRPLEIVVAHYNEDLSWLFPWEPYVTVYHKGDRTVNYLPKRFNKWIYLDNVGREGHTYLHHMTTRYNSLAEITIFLQARVDDHPHLTINEYILRAKQTGFSHIPCIRQKSWDDRIVHDVKWLREYNNGQLEPACHTFGEFWDYLFGRPLKPTTDNSRCQCLRQHIPLDYTKPRPLRWYRPKVQNTIRPGGEKSNFVLMKYPCCRPQVLEFFWAGCFGVSRETVHQNPISFYSKIIPIQKKVIT